MADIRVFEKTIPGIQLVVFDKDGTIIDLFYYWSRMVLLRAEEICSLLGLPDQRHIDGLVEAMGVDLKKKCLKPKGPVGFYSRDVVREAVEEYLERNGIYEASKLCVQAFEEADRRSLSGLLSLLKPIPGVESFIDALSKKGVKIALATTDRTERAALALEKLGLKDYFHVIVGFDKVARTKPAPDILEYINERTSVPANASVMIGDTYHDIETGKNAGYAAQIVLRSQITEENRLKTLTEYCINDFNDLQII